MYKILKRGEKKYRIYCIRCDDCDSKFEIDEQDKEFFLSKDELFKLQIKCPCCNSVNKVLNYDTKELTKDEYEKWIDECTAESVEEEKQDVEYDISRVFGIADGNGYEYVCLNCDYGFKPDKELTYKSIIAYAKCPLCGRDCYTTRPIETEGE